ncbi:MAG: hypothetical protein AB2653_10685 [Candidatus Thiodiazotropha endolucinida]
MKYGVIIFKLFTSILVIFIFTACNPVVGNKNAHVTVSNETGELLEHLVISLNNENCSARNLSAEGSLQCEFSEAGGGFSIIAATESEKRTVLKEVGQTKAGKSYRHNIVIKANGEAIFDVKQLIH